MRTLCLVAVLAILHLHVNGNILMKPKPSAPYGQGILSWECLVFTYLLQEPHHWDASYSKLKEHRRGSLRGLMPHQVTSTIIQHLHAYLREYSSYAAELMKEKMPVKRMVGQDTPYTAFSCFQALCMSLPKLRGRAVPTPGLVEPQLRPKGRLSIPFQRYPL